MPLCPSWPLLPFACLPWVVCGILQRPEGAAGGRGQGQGPRAGVGGVVEVKTQERVFSIFASPFSSPAARSQRQGAVICFFPLDGFTTCFLRLVWDSVFS